MANPEGDAFFPAQLQKFQGMAEAVASIAAVLLLGGKFQVRQHQVRLLQDPFRPVQRDCP